MTMTSTTPLVDTNDAQIYFDERLNTGAWDGATSAQKTIALQSATRAINKLKFKGKRAISTQPNAFPRDDDTVVPLPVQQACCELAYQLLDGVDPGYEIENIAATADGYSSVRTSFIRDFAQPHIMAGIPSTEAWQLLLPYMIENVLDLRLRRK